MVQIENKRVWVGKNRSDRRYRSIWAKRSHDAERVASTSRADANAVGDNSTGKGESSADSRSEATGSEKEGGGDDDDPAHLEGVYLNVYINPPESSFRHLVWTTIVKELLKLPWAILLAIIIALLLQHYG